MQRYGNSKKIPNFFVEFLLCLTIFNTMETNTTLKDRLQMILEMTGLSIAAFERKLGWSNGSFSKISDTLSFGRVKTIVDTFGINRDWLISGKGEMITIHDANLTQKVLATSMENASSTPETTPTDSVTTSFLPDYDSTYRVTVETLKPSIEVGDLLFLKRIENKSVISGNPYLIKAYRYGAVLSVVDKQNGEIVCTSAGNLLITAVDISEIYAIVGQFKFAVNLDVKEKVLYDELKLHSDRMTSIVDKNSEIIKGLTDSNASMQKQIDVLLGMLNKKI